MVCTFHSDSNLSSVQKVENVYFLNFTKSNNTCKICKLIHHSNRQFLKYDCKKKLVSYHCFDGDAKDKKILKFF